MRDERLGEARDDNVCQVLGGGVHLQIVLPRVGVGIHKPAVRVGAQRDGVLLHKLGAKQAVQVRARHLGDGLHGWHSAAEVQQVVAAVRALVPLDVCRRVQSYARLVAVHPAEVWLDVHGLGGALHDAQHALVLGVHCVPPVVGTIHKRARVERQEGDGNQAEPHVVHQGHERHVQVVDAAAEVADEPLQLVARRLRRRVVAAVDVVVVHSKLEEDTVHDELGPARNAAHVLGPDSLLLEVALGDDDAAIDLGRVDEVLAEVQQLRVVLHGLGHGRVRADVGDG
mmetsp:Transcript_7050/g.17845  ORF Transcript_7050/g.17845 Transcript_7050/m.17845 type:complete len:284 (-) Transcript_7050:226-1077(-)